MLWPSAENVSLTVKRAKLRSLKRNLFKEVLSAERVLVQSIVL